MCRLFRDAKRPEQHIVLNSGAGQRSGMRNPIPRIDCHAHIFTSSMQVAGDAWHVPTGDAPVEDLLTTFRSAGISHGILAAASIFGDNNDYALAEASRCDNLKTTVIVQPSQDYGLLRRMKDAGAVGIRLQLRNKPLPDLKSDEYRGLLRAVCELGWHVELHDDLARIPKVLCELEDAGVPVVIDHFARPAKIEDISGPDFAAVLAAIDRGRTWVKISAGFRLPSFEVARHAANCLLAAGGTQRVVWGSDWPFVGFASVSYADTVSQYERLVPDATVREGINMAGIDLYFPELRG